jgi:hypothetical protein
MQRHRWSRFVLPLAAGLLAPLGGLLLNRKIPFPCDLQAPGVYALTVLNGLVLLIPSPVAPGRALCLWLGRSILYAFSLYFFVVFLPFLPLSLLAMLVFGAGFLLLAPTLLFVVHTRHLLEEGAALAARWGRFPTILAFALCLSVIPLTVTLRALSDRAALRQALDVAFSPDFRTDSAGLNRAATRRGLQHLREMKDGIALPFLSDYYNALVFNNMVLTEDKTRTLHRMFFGEAEPQAGKRERWSLFLSPRAESRWRERSRRAEPPRQVELREVTLDESATDDVIKAAVTLSMQNTGPFNSEFTTEIAIPDGVLVTGYWLDCQGKRKPGRLVEKKTAEWVYHMIRDFTRRDPGLLVFKDDTHLKLSVFPFAVNETRTTGLEFMFPRGMQPRLSIGSREIRLGASDATAATAPLVAESPDGIVHVTLSDIAVQQLPTVTRVPYLHFIVDRSAQATNGYAALAAQAGQLARLAPEPSAPCRVTFANYEWLDASRDPIPPAAVQRLITDFDVEALPARGGFCYDRAIARCLVQQQEREATHTGGVLRVPVFIVIPAQRSEPVSSVQLAPFRRLVPDAPAYYLATGTGLLRVPFEGGPSRNVDRVEAPHPVLAFASDEGIAVCRPDASMCQIALPGTAGSLGYYDPVVAAFRPLRGVRLLEQTAYVKGLALWDDYRATRWKPSTLDAAMPGILEQGRATGVLTPLAAYMVVENTAQEHTLKQKEKQALGASHALDFEETTPTQVSPEPGILWLAPVAAWLLIGRRKRKA